MTPYIMQTLLLKLILITKSSDNKLKAFKILVTESINKDHKLTLSNQQF
jgi:hypothetical protein